MILNLYMKSGNKIRLPAVKNYNFKMQGNNVVSLSIELMSEVFDGEKLLGGTVDLSQIEALTTEKESCDS